MKIDRFYKAVKSVLLLALTFLSILSAAQTSVRGVVTDVKTKETLPYVSVTIPGTSLGTRTDADGKFSIKIPGAYTRVSFTYVGYNSVIKNIVAGQDQVLNVQLQPTSKVLNEVVVKSGRRKKYRNKNNPAVELIEKVIENKSKNRIESYSYAEYEKYEKLSFSLSDITDKFRNKKVFKNYQFLFKQQDSSAIGGATIMPLYMEETLSKNYYRKNPEKNKTIVLAKKKVDFDPKYIDQQGVSAYMNRMYQDIDIYDNNIAVVSNQFLSPISNNAPMFYMYFITDTVKRGDAKFVELSFAPRNKGDMLFQGKLYVSLDGTYAVESAYLTVHKNINLNFVRQFESKLEFEKNDIDGHYHLSKSTLNINFGISKNKGTGVFGERTVSFKDYKLNQPGPDSVYQGAPVVVATSPAEKQDGFWVQNRHEQLSSSEVSIYRNIDSLQNMRSFKRTMELVTFLFAGYKSFGPFEVGPANTFYSFNPVEGLRLRLGGRTTPELSKRYYFETYAAYGTRDDKWKYFGSATYSINNKSIYAFPQHYLRTSFQRDTKIPGQELQFVQEDNFLLSFKRGENDRWLYNDLWRLDYVHEYENHFSYSVGFKKWKQTPAGGLRYQKWEDNVLSPVRNVNTSELSLELRYAPNEKFYQGKIYRTPIFGPDPIFTLRYTQGIKGLLGGEYNYQNLTGNIQKRFYLSQLGYTDMTVEGGYIFGQAPFALLAIHRANQTYAYQLNSYNLMNFLEFVSDHYASINIDHSFNGFFFNKIPLIRKLKLREVVSFKGLYGGVRNENDPYQHPDLLQFPTNDDGIRSTYTLEKQPYMEGSVGIANIFKLFRVDLVKRFTYLDHPDVAEWGVRARVKFDF